MLNAVGHLLSYVESTDTPWKVPLGMIVPRDPHFWSQGDASLLGGGAYCPGLRFWFNIGWSLKVLHGVRQVKPSSPGFVHINVLEFIVIILQLAAIKTRLATMTTEEESIYFPLGRPNLPSQTFLTWFCAHQRARIHCHHPPTGSHQNPACHHDNRGRIYLLPSWPS
jgi:hypothetical protein